MAIVHLLMNFKRKELMTKQEVIQSIIDVQDAIEKYHYITPRHGNRHIITYQPNDSRY